MKTTLTAFATTLFLLSGFSSVWAANPVPEKMDWWLDAKFGMFIHWGPSSVAGVEIGWARETHPFDHPGKGELVPDAVYDALYKEFNPVEFDADALVRTAKEAGMKYIVFTAKHHDGFSNWPTKLSDYNIANTPFKRDICKELADAVHRHGLKLGWYYSTRDWSHPDYLVGDNSKYNDFYHGQIRELLSNYGEVSVMWFDHVAGDWSDRIRRSHVAVRYQVADGYYAPRCHDRRRRGRGVRQGGERSRPAVSGRTIDPTSLCPRAPRRHRVSADHAGTRLAGLLLFRH